MSEINEQPLLPLPEGDKGKIEVRDESTGRFLKGNKTGRGNPLNSKAQKLRAYLLREVKVEDFDKALARLRKLIQSDNEHVALLAIKEFLDRTIGKAPQQIDMNLSAAAVSPEEMRARALKMLGFGEDGK